MTALSSQVTFWGLRRSSTSVSIDSSSQDEQDEWIVCRIQFYWRATEITFCLLVCLPSKVLPLQLNYRADFFNFPLQYCFSTSDGWPSSTWHDLKTFGISLVQKLMCWLNKSQFLECKISTLKLILCQTRIFSQHETKSPINSIGQRRRKGFCPIAEKVVQLQMCQNKHYRYFANRERARKSH